MLTSVQSSHEGMESSRDCLTSSAMIALSRAIHVVSGLNEIVNAFIEDSNSQFDASLHSAGVR